jgi:hypothetical protein
MPPLGECLRGIARAAAMAEEFVETTQNTYKALLLASNYGALRSLVVTIILGPKLDPLLSSLMQQRQQALFKCEMP